MDSSLSHTQPETKLSLGQACTRFPMGSKQQTPFALRSGCLGDSWDSPLTRPFARLKHPPIFLSVHTEVKCIFGEVPLHAELKVRSGASVNFVTLVFDLRTSRLSS